MNLKVQLPAEFLVLRDRLLTIPEYRSEIEYVRNILTTPLEKIGPEEFLEQYAFVVACSYWKEQYARKEWEPWLVDKDVSHFSNRRKRESIRIGMVLYKDWWEKLLISNDKLAFLDSLPMIGEVTRCHLARNIGIDCVKPDRHMVRLALKYGYFSFPLKPTKVPIVDQWESCTRMCSDIQRIVAPYEKLGTIDVILWRSCNLGMI